MGMEGIPVHCSKGLRKERAKMATDREELRILGANCDVPVDHAWSTCAKR